MIPGGRMEVVSALCGEKEVIEWKQGSGFSILRGKEPPSMEVRWKVLH